ncbi:hypothetical protein [Streptomyces zagrosensis]|uniref:Uncharacterized protein n=1 Tax=Streptomyces zagrosensis TaxID=1042984 RepID=A0A7W9UZF2_9ACTN|nr:hypothetical protein [Streptomyces zagrosensis]MBB5936677.1 hypothetical protein [Streptomyces zagrosensis]
MNAVVDRNGCAASMSWVSTVVPGAALARTAGHQMVAEALSAGYAGTADPGRGDVRGEIPHEAQPSHAFHPRAHSGNSTPSAIP